MNKFSIFIARAAAGLILASLLFSACRKDDHFMGGSPTKAQSDLTTYDYLKANPLFDTLVQLIDKAGLKETVNSNITFIAVTNYSVKSFLDVRTRQLQKATNNENVKYTLDSIKAPELRDSLLAYCFKGSIVRSDLSMESQVYKNMVGEDFAFKLTLLNSDILSAGVKYITLAKVINGLDPDPLPDNFPPGDRDKVFTLQTTGILTKTGVLHVLQNNHVFYWK
ncbi:hypothetical protein [Chitinophaga sp. 212800010-3]|uniref:hypothetical protein n=1 Tax=unclassified Chitinophaga TaxID=2619133 RepID=UPI002DE7E2CE|nr:FAS1 domain-containing protein [Chitinophaga sp. 212800010-3]